jgi:hypothetical protein
MKHCTTITEVQRFLGAWVFYLIWILHFAHVANPLYQLFKERKKIQLKK